MDNTNPNPNKIPQNQNNQPRQGPPAPYATPNPAPQPIQNPQAAYQQQPLQPQQPSLPNQYARPISNVDSVAPPVKQSRWGSLSGLISIAQLLFGALILALFINNFVFQSYQVFGESMTPTLQEGDRLIVSKLSRSWNSIFGDNYLPSRGDIIVFESTIQKDVQLVKRVIALPGERVVVADGDITVFNDENPNGFNVDASFNADIPQNSDGNVDISVGIGQLFVSGDNRFPGGSLDSRNQLGLVPLDNVVGELMLRLFPIGQAKFF